MSRAIAVTFIRTVAENLKSVTLIVVLLIGPGNNFYIICEKIEKELQYYILLERLFEVFVKASLISNIYSVRIILRGKVRPI